MSSTSVGLQMSGEVYRLVYMSECLLPAGNEDYPEAINNLLNDSRIWNVNHAITGSLLFSTGYFAQVLEGPKQELQSLMGHIICDPRHHNLRLIERGPVTERLFGNWSMAYTDGNEQLDLLMIDVLGLPQESQGAAILRMLRHMVTPDDVSLGRDQPVYA